MLFYYKVAVKAPLFPLLTYSSKEKIQLGSRVNIPLGLRKTQGLVVSEIKEPDIQNIKQIKSIDTDVQALSLERLKWLKWLSYYYNYPLGLISDMCFPPLSFKPSKELMQEHASLHLKNTLNTDQKKIFDQVSLSSGFKAHLLYGVTGSGKTEVYKALSKHFIKQNKQVLMLVPEIFLCLQIQARLQEEFQGQLAVLHSDLTKRQKTEAWFQMLKKEKNLLVGTRSALFCPLPDLGLIVLDEEHVSSFKQEDKFRYHARDSALKLAQILDIPCLLGSATPSFETWHNVKSKSFQLHQLNQRALKQEMPKIKVIDLKNSPLKDGLFWLSEELCSRIQNCLDNKKQVGLFLNRRGQASSLLCRSCGQVPYCPDCDIALTLHQKEHLVCHYCDHHQKKPSRCSVCKETSWIEKGLGTEKVEEVLKSLFPEARILRADRDSLDSKKDMELLLNSVKNLEVDIIVGTQMLAKGLNFPSIQLVGIVMADMDFHFPDFRATERSFQTLIQMSGRSGRAQQGDVLIQTFCPSLLNEPLLRSHNYAGFVEEELKNREKFYYPPFSKLCLFQVESKSESKGQSFAFRLVKKAEEYLSSGIQILGPAPSPLFKIRSFYRFQILVKASSYQKLQAFLDKFLPQTMNFKGCRVKVDRDPVSML